MKALLSYDCETGVFSRIASRNKARWVGKKAGCTMQTGYQMIWVMGKRYLANRLAWLRMFTATGRRCLIALTAIQPTMRYKTCAKLPQRRISPTPAFDPITKVDTRACGDTMTSSGARE